MSTAAVLQKALKKGGGLRIGNVLDGYEAFLLAEIVRQRGHGGPIVFVLRDGNRMSELEDALRFVAPDLPVLTLPAWDCLPYDRVGPSSEAAARRLSAMSAIGALRREPHRALILTSANALLQRMPPLKVLEDETIAAKSGGRISMDHIVRVLQRGGFERTTTVRERGEFAVRGGILDLFAPGDEEPVRLDFFGDTLESIRTFDPATQRTSGQRKSFELAPVSEVTLKDETISRFRSNYVKRFGAPSREDALYTSISDGRRFSGMEHWLPLFYESVETLFDYVAGFTLVLDHLVVESVAERRKLVLDYYDARRRGVAEGSAEAVPYNPLPPQELYLTEEELTERLAAADPIRLSSYAVTDAGFQTDVVNLDVHRGRNFASERQAGDVNVFGAAVDHIAALRANGKQVILAAWSEGSRERLTQVVEEHGLGNIKPVDTLKQALEVGRNIVATAVLGIEAGFETDRIAVVGEQDILGDRLVRRGRRKKRGSDFISEATGLDEGDIVVHVDHGIARFVGLRSIEAAGAPHDCLELSYAGGDRLFLPVENIELLSRYGGEGSDAVLDKLGGGAWQARKAKLKKRLLDMAGGLIRIAAERQMRGAPKLVPPDGLWGEFQARFPYEETEDQLNAIDAVADDLSAGKPMDRLVCGDVGFGKTEVALRAAFIAAMNGLQVAVVVPTTLLARQHFKTFTERFHGLPLNVVQASRLVTTKELNENKKGLANGTVDIVVGTHALLGKGVEFKNLGLLIIDEEQHFGVKHKERLKELKSDVHVLTLSATPIPRTLQLALTGVRELSLITTPPVDRMAVRTFIAPFDPLVVRETLLRERYRGGQSFYVAPRLSDLAGIREFLEEQVPEVKVALAHGQMPAGELDDIMNAFYEGQYDVLLSTTIVESGLDIPSANTMIVHRADMFGLAQLYQLRGRVGRSKQRAYALMTIPANKTPTAGADRRLKVLQSLDTLGAGFQLASHDLDQRGAGNLLGDEQSGHVKEVGFELYQQMLEEAVAEMKGVEPENDGSWSPQITLGTAVMIPDTYVPDLQLRMTLYRRLAELTEAREIDAFGAELIDRFGALPTEVEHLLKVVFIKSLCRRSNIEKLDAGPKGLVVNFRDKSFSNPAALVRYIGEQGTLAKIRPDQSIVLIRDWPKPEQRLNGAATIVTQLARFADDTMKKAA
ncbi:transcription-repair coupling factor [Aureimonas jatrophae]|uniref:Transcription-repair-coupling factor n=1 Tax=Aureimonas jatrophae TaxID=1166073 RepID=A0A1H0NER9_9HYPH|nr:transcription-repair coupling factor [Aureimonas jatrophae]MBB3953061.1 transcription-repair coupling factor (superfamily II helicase) [Aureimonas jatrophae]SDO91081.1 transcription-repair coupling factor [Aureimonas jatrophae]